MGTPFRTKRHARTVALLAWLWSVPALAETIVLLEVPEAERGERRAELEAAVTRVLSAEGVRVLSQQDARALVGGAAASCAGPECTAELVRGAGADAAIALAWAPETSSAEATLRLTLIDRADRAYPGEARADDGDFERAAREALLDARSLQLLGEGPWLRVRSNPSGARVLLDGRPIGTTPTRAAVAPGRHTLEIRQERLRPHAQTVDVPENASRPIEIAIDLLPRARPRASRPRAPVATRPRQVHSEPSPAPERPVLGPLLLSGVGLALLGYDLAHVAADLCQQRDATGLCVDRSSIDPVPAVILGSVGVAAMAGGLAWYLFGAPSPEAPTVAMTGRGVTLQTRF